MFFKVVDVVRAQEIGAGSDGGEVGGEAEEGVAEEGGHGRGINYTDCFFVFDYAVL